MTIETKCVVAPEDILAVRFECAKCHTSISIPIGAGVAVHASDASGGMCSFCHTPWQITPNSAEHKALVQFAAGLESIAAHLQGRTLMLRLEVKGPLQP